MRQMFAGSSIIALATVVFGLLAPCPLAAQTTYTWNNSAGGSWSAAGNWTPVGPAIGSTTVVNTADFSMQALSANAAVTLDGNQSIGNLNFGDANPVPTYSWTINPGTPATSTLTLVSSGMPTINVVNDTATINVVLAGTQGFTKTGAGNLVLAAANTYSGVTTLNAGQLSINNDLALGTSTLTINGGTIDSTSGAAVTLTTNNAQTWAGSFAFGGSSPLNLGTGPVALTSLTLTLNGTNPLTVGGVISGASQKLTLAGTGTLILTGANTYTGGTVIGSGATLQIGVGTTSGGLPISGAPITFSSSTSTLTFFLSTASVILPWSQFAGPGNVNYLGTNSSTTVGDSWSALTLNTNFTGTLNVNQARVEATTATTLGGTTKINVLAGGQVWGAIAAQTYHTPLTLAGNGWYDSPGTEAGALRLAAATWSGNITLTANARISPTPASGSATITGTISGAGFQLEVGNGGADGSGSLNLNPSSGVNSFSALLISSSINPGAGVSTNTVVAGNPNALPGGAAPAALTINGGTLELNNSSFTFANLSGLSGAVGNFGATTASTITIGSDNSSTTYTGNVIDGGAKSLNVNKVGSGTLVLAGINSYTGTTTVTAGTLAVQSLAATAAVTVQGNAGLTVFGVPSSTLTINSLTLGSSNAGASLGFILNGASATAALSVSTLNLNAAAGSTTTLSVASSVLLPSNVTIPLFNYTNATGTPVSSAFTLALPPRASGSLVYNSGQVALQLTTLGAIAWAPVVNTTWNVGSGIGVGGTNNWNSSTTGTSTNFIAGDAVIFDDTAGAGNGNVNVAAAVAPSSITFNNSAVPYTLSGPGNIGGMASVAANGPGAVTVAVPISGTGGVAVSGGGTLTLAAANTYAAGTLLSSGQLNINAGGNGPTSSAIGVGQLVITGGTIDNTSGAPVTLGTNNVQTWSNNFTFGGSNPLNLGLGPVTLTSTLTLTLNGIAPLTVGGVISGASKGLTLAGPGTLIVTATNTYTGNTTIGSGSTLQVGSGTTTGSITASPSISIANNGTLEFYLSTTNVTLPWTQISSLTTGGSIYYLGTNSPTSVTSYTSLTPAANPSGPGLPASFTGTIAVNQARLQAYTPSSFGGTTGINILAGGQLMLSDISPPAFPTYATNITIAGNGWFDNAAGPQAGAIRIQAVGITYAGNITLGANARISPGTTSATMNITGSISGPFQLEVGNGGTDGSGTVTLTPATGNTFSALMISSSVGNANSPVNTVVAGNPKAFPSGTPASLVMNGGAANGNAVLQLNTSTSTNTGFSFANLSGSFGTIGNYSPSTPVTITIGSGNYGGTLVDGGNAPLGLIKTGSGTLVLTSANAYSGGTTIMNGTLTSQTAVSLGSGQVTLAGSSTLSAASGLVNGVAGLPYANPVSIANGATVAILAANTAALPTVTMNTLTFVGAATLNTAADSTSVPNNQPYGLTFGAVTLSGVNTINVSNNGSGLGTVTLGPISDPVGTLIKTGAGTLVVSGSGAYTGGTQIMAGTLTFANGGLESGPVTFTGDGTLQWAGGNTQDISNVLSINDAVNGTIDTNGNNVVFASPIGVGAMGTGALTKTGAGTLSLTTPNTYTGGTTILNGTLNVNSDSALGTGPGPVYGVVYLTGGTLQFASGGGITLNASRSIVLGGGAFDTNFGNDTVAGVISGSDPVNSNLIKNGSGDLTVTNTNTYAGSTIVNAGGLVVGTSGSLGSGPLVVTNTNTAPTSTVLYVYNTAGQTVGPLSGQVTQASNGNTAGIFLGTGVTLTVNQTAPGTFQGTIMGGGSLTLGGSSNSTLTLSGNSTYGGSTTVNGGTIQLGVANALPATTPLTLGNGGTLDLNNNDQTIAALVTGSSGNINTGSGTGGILTVGNTAGGTVTYSGVISGTGGLSWGIVNTNVANPTPSTLLLASASTNTGPMTINSGTLSIGTAYALSGGVAPVLPYNMANTYPGAFTLGPTATLLTNGFNLTVGSLGGGGPIGGNINLGNNSSSTLYIVQSIVMSSSTGYAGIISGTGNVFIVNGVNLAVYGNWTLTGGVTHDVTPLVVNHSDSPQSYLPFATSGPLVATQGIEFAGFTDQVSTIYGGSAGDNNGKGTFVDATGDAGKLVLSYYAASVANGGPANGSGGTQNFSGFFANDVGVIFDAGYFGNAQQLTLSGPNNTTGPLTIGFTNQTTPQNGAATGAQSGVMNQVIISATSTFGTVTVGNIAVSNLINNLTIQPTGNMTATSVTIGDAFPGSTGNNSLTVGGTLTAGSVNIGNTNLYGANVLTILGTGTVKASGAITIGNDNATGSGTLNVNGALGTASAPVTSLSIQGGGVLEGYGTITASSAASNVITITNGTIRGGFDDTANQLGTLTIALNSGATARTLLVIQGSGNSGLGQTGAIMTEVLATSSTAATNSKINITGANMGLNLNTLSGGAGSGSGQINIVLYDPTASLTPGSYTFVLATVATAGKIQLGGSNQPANTLIDTGTTMGPGSGSTGNADLYIQGASQTYMNSVIGWSLAIDSTGKQLELSVVSNTIIPEPEHLLLMCVGVLMAGFAIRRRLRAVRPVC